jgi:hypothetical protein
MDGANVVSHTFIPVDSVKLGRLVIDVKEPCKGYLDPVPAATDVSVIRHPQCTDSERGAANNNFASSLIQLSEVARSRRTGKATRVTTGDLVTYQLQSPEEWFRNAIKEETVRLWMEDGIKAGSDVYLVAGYHTMLHPEVFDQHQILHGTSQLPHRRDSDAHGSASRIPEDGGSLEGASDSDLAKQGFQKVLVASGEQVCALQIRKVQFELLSSSKLGSVGLDEDNTWKVSWGARSQQDGLDDVLSATLQSDLQSEPELEDDLEKFAVDGGGRFYIEKPEQT